MMTSICKIGIREFGPIKEGTGENLIEIKKCTFLVGAQGSGKSSVAKLIAEFSWLEKALARGEVSVKDLERKNRFRDHYCAYHRLTTYFREETSICYVGRHYEFHYEKGQLRVVSLRGEMYVMPKIMYIPAERNVFGITEKVGIVKYFTDSLRTFWDAYEDARLAVKVDVELPVDGMHFSYDRLNKISWIKGSTYRTRLSESASGYQSLVPLFLVSRYLSDTVGENAGETDIDPENYRRLQKEVNNIMQNGELTDDVRAAVLKSLSSRFRYSCFVNIVEEPELNLYPESQRNLLQELVSFANKREENKLLLTTHSPYILSALNNLLYACQVGRKYKAEVGRIIPEKYWIASEHVVAYALEKGRIVPIMDEVLQQVEAERIDGISEVLNRQYEQLLALDSCSL